MNKLEIEDNVNNTLTNQLPTIEYSFVFNTTPLSYYRTLRKTKSGRTYLTKEGKEYRKTIKEQVEAQMFGYNIDVLKGNLSATFIFFHDNRRKNDLDNSLKSILDCFNEVLFEDDSQLISITLSKKYDKQEPRIELLIKPLK